MSRRLAIACSLLVVSGCGPPEESTGPARDDVSAVADEDAMSLDARRALGREIYRAACAECHDEGKGRAPALGDAEAWSQRSPLWDAVLKDHAESGYMQMPAKGGDLELTAEAVAAASEYLATWSQPERLPAE